VAFEKRKIAPERRNPFLLHAQRTHDAFKLRPDIGSNGAIACLAMIIRNSGFRETEPVFNVKVPAGFHLSRIGRQIVDCPEIKQTIL
jgi:hypothetical protein